MSLNNIVDVGGAILVELNMVTWTFLCNDKNRIRVVRIKIAEPTEDDNCNVNGAKYAQLIGFLEETILTLDVGMYKICRGGGGDNIECQAREQKNRDKKRKKKTFKKVTERFRSC